MANTLKLRGGTTSDVAAATLAEREIMVDTTKDVIVVGPSKNEMAKADGATFTGATTFANTVTFNGAVTLNNSINCASQRVQNVGTPTGASDATNKSYVDTQIQTVIDTTLPGNVFSADSTITITDNAPATGDVDLSLSDNGVTEPKILTGAVTENKLANSAVTETKIQNLAVKTDKIYSQAVTEPKIAVSAVTESRIATGAVSNTKLANDSVITDRIAADAVTNAKLADDAVQQENINGLTATITELNQVDGKTLVPGTVTWSNTNSTEIPSVAQINSFVLSVTDAIGGYVAIADEVSFPNANPDPSDNAGTVVSIHNAGGMVIDSSGNGAGTALDTSAVTITGFPSYMYSTTVDDGLGLQVQTTSTLHTYTFHRAIAKDADVVQLSSDINDFKARYRIGPTEPTTDLTYGDLFYDTTLGTLKSYNGTAWVGTVAGNAAQLTSAASGNLVSTNVQAALEELQGDVDGIEGFVDATNNKIKLGDADALEIGDDADLRIYWDNTNSDIKLKNSGTYSFLNSDTTKAALELDPEGSSKLKYNGYDRVVTTVGGLSLTGDVTVNPSEQLRFLESPPAAGGTGTQNYIAIAGPSLLDESSGTEVNYVITLPTSTPDVSGKALVGSTTGQLSWATIDTGISGGGTDRVFFENDKTVTTSYSITSGKNAMSAGPITINAGLTVTVPANSSWTIV